MKLRIASTLFLSALTSLAFAECDPAMFYVSVFGGSGSSKHLNVTQLGTVHFSEVAGGALAVNAAGRLNNPNASFFGAQVGYQVQEICLSSGLQWTLAPAVELEWYSMNKKTFNAELMNFTDRLDEHDFLVSYPMKRNVFLANAVLNFNYPCLPAHPYIGFGIGSAILRISDATSLQIDPPEVDINHYNGNPNDAYSTFAGQIKLGFTYDIYPCISLFAEYRWLYLANTHFVFGSTNYPSHAATSSWQVNLDPQGYNLGSIGVRYNW